LYLPCLLLQAHQQLALIHLKEEGLWLGSCIAVLYSCSTVTNCSYVVLGAKSLIDSNVERQLCVTSHGPMEDKKM